MKTTFTRTLILAATLATAVLAPPRVGAQEWSAAQRDILKNVEAYWALEAARDLEGFLGYFHADYLGWSNDEALPTDKAGLKKWVEHQFKTTKTVLYEIKPVGVRIQGNVAIVHYYWTTVNKTEEGKEKQRSGRWTDILARQGDRWVLIGDHGGRTDKE